MMNDVFICTKNDHFIGGNIYEKKCKIVKGRDGAYNCYAVAWAKGRPTTLLGWASKNYGFGTGSFLTLPKYDLEGLPLKTEDNCKQFQKDFEDFFEYEIFSNAEGEKALSEW